VTYCIAIRVKQGLIALADGRITAGSQVTVARKLTMHGPDGSRFFIMTSGLRSVRDKTIAYMNRYCAENQKNGFPTLLDAAAAYSKFLRMVNEEDAETLERSNLSFNLHTLIGGQMAKDPHPTIFLIYPEGNWVEVNERTPYLTIGETGYGKPILDRALTYNSDVEAALKVAYLSFDSTRYSSANVGYPIDMVTYYESDKKWREISFEMDELIAQRQWWNENITGLVREMPDGPWAKSLTLSKTEQDSQEEPLST